MVEGVKDCGEGWKVASTPLECSAAVTAVGFAPNSIADQRYTVFVVCILSPSFKVIGRDIDKTCHSTLVVLWLGIFGLVLPSIITECLS